MHPRQSRAIDWIEGGRQQAVISVTAGQRTTHVDRGVDRVADAGGTDKLTVEYVQQQCIKVPDPVVANPPPGGSKGYQTQVTSEVLRAMFGGEAEQTIRSKVEAAKPMLRQSGGLLQS